MMGRQAMLGQLKRTLAGIVSFGLIACATVGAVGCSNSLSPSSSGSLRATVTDPVGDAVPDGTGALVPDLVGATIQVEAGVLTATLSFAPGTLSQSTSFWSLGLDTDENPSTGAVSQGTDTIGVDYIIQGHGAEGSIFHVVPATLVSRAVVTFPTKDSLSVAASLAVLGSDDGRLKFRVTARPNVPGASQVGTQADDYMPDLGLFLNANTMSATWAMNPAIQIPVR